MGWAAAHIVKLQRGERVSFRPRGNSMSPRIESGDLVTVEPIVDHAAIQPDDVVLCRVSGAEYLHIVETVRVDGDARSFLIRNNKGRSNGWTPARHVFGKCVSVQP